MIPVVEPVMNTLKGRIWDLGGPRYEMVGKIARELKNNVTNHAWMLTESAHC